MSVGGELVKRGEWERTPFWMLWFGHRSFRRKVYSGLGTYWEYSE